MMSTGIGFSLAPTQMPTTLRGKTTAPGAANGSTAIDTGLIGNVIGRAHTFVVEPYTPALTDSREISSFDTLTGAMTFDRSFGRQILAGVSYAILADLTAGDRIGHNLATPSYLSPLVVPNVDGDLLERTEALLQKSLLLTPNLVEFWDGATLDPSLWSTAVAGGGIINLAVPVARTVVSLQPGAPSGSARFDSRDFLIWGIVPVSATQNAIVSNIPQGYVLEWEMIFYDLASVNWNSFFVGYSPSNVATRATVNINGFILQRPGAVSLLSCLTDSAGVEELTDVSAFYPGDTNFGKYRVEVLPGGDRFYINEQLVATHAARTVNTLNYLNFYNQSSPAAVGAAGIVQIGRLRLMTFDEQYS